MKSFLCHFCSNLTTCRNFLSWDHVGKCMTIYSLSQMEVLLTLVHLNARSTWASVLKTRVYAWQCLACKYWWMRPSKLNNYSVLGVVSVTFSKSSFVRIRNIFSINLWILCVWFYGVVCCKWIPLEILEVKTFYSSMSTEN